MSFSFGSTAAAAPAASSGFSFGGGAAPATGTSSGFSFGGGAAAAPATSTAGSGFSFGATPSTATTGSTGFSFGGGAPTTSTAPATSAGGFGFGSTPSAAPATSSGFGFGATSAPASGSLFGSTATTATTGSSLFGGASTPSTTGSSLFGGSGATGSSLFGGGATTGSSLFGAPATAATPSAFGSGLGFGAQQQPAQPQPAITLETVFDTLPADVKKNITDFHQFLKEEDQSDAFLKTVSKGKLSDLDANLEQLEQDVLLRRNLQDRQATSVHNVRKDVKHLIHQVDTATLNLRSMSGESTSQRFYGIMRRVEMPSAYYWQLLTSFEERMEQIKTQIESVESEFQPLYEKHRRGESSSSQTVDPAMLQQILLSQNAALMQVAAHVAEVHERTEEMRQAFIRKMKEDLIKHGDKNLTTFKNPFDKKKKNASRESDIDTIRFKTSVAPTIVATQQAPQVQQPATTGFGFGTAAPAPAATGTTSLFAPTTLSTGTSSFGTSTPAASTTSLFAPTVSTGATPTTTTSTGFGFGGGLGSTAPAPITAPKQVSFNLGGTATPTGTTSNPGSMAFGFSSAPATPAAGASTGGFGSTTTSFLGASAGDKRGSTATSGAKTLRARQKKR
ncbi:hypothetical protein Poli38472_014662 [Pythium oligandrum]|uniref:Nucleoporin p58/p45 n=1 Tax=Pythium oligandrum TaxID=41045 RepID=A0A8K1CKL0_PYTOL|nr:hypothetical protein Poli38472_014662 [Pythium oligandrum]|eukprot:TMW63957.1 hypothetical protein Poli38472_014662 [Pythium oligandrum]